MHLEDLEHNLSLMPSEIETVRSSFKLAGLLSQARLKITSNKQIEKKLVIEHNPDR
jgi:hypothetical protein